MSERSREGAYVTRLAVPAAVILGAMCPLALCGEIDSLALLNQARAKIVENIERLPKYTCVQTDRKSTRLNSSHLGISYAVFCFKKQKIIQHLERSRLRWPSRSGAAVRRNLP